MKIILKDSATGESTVVTLAKNDLVVAIKLKAQESFPSLKGSLLQVICPNSKIELQDERYIGDYKHIRSNSELVLIAPVSQPYSDVDYKQIEAKLVKSMEKKPLEEFFDRKEEDNDWVKDWTKGEEYLSYPPVDVYGQHLTPQVSTNIWKDTGAVVRKASSSRITEREKSPNEEDFSKRMEDYMNKMLDRGRSFKSVYVCQVNQFRFSFMHKFEGKWSGTALHYLVPFQSGSEEDLMHSCSSKMVFDARSKVWVEHQLYTHKNGLTNSRLFHYKPIADGVCQVSCDDPRFMESVVFKLREEGDDVLLLTGVNTSTGNIVITESIVMSSHMDTDRRTRTITRLDPRGGLLGIVVCKEKRVIDEETGALSASVF